MKKIINLTLVLSLFVMSLPISVVEANGNTNLLKNGNFSEIEKDESGQWKDGIKPKFWLFEKYSGSKASYEDFQANIDGGQVTVESKTKWQSPLTFLKPTERIKIKSGYIYELSFEYKTDLVDKIENKNHLQVAFDVYHHGQRNSQQSKEFLLEESSDWKKSSHEITADGNFDELLPVFKLNYSKGTYSIRNIELTEKERTFELKSLEFIQKEIKINKGDQIRLPLDINPVHYPINNLNWDSSKPDVVSVDETGQITAHKQGQSVVTVRGLNTDLKSSIRVTVLELEKKNMLKNSDFEIIEKAPLKENTSENKWHQDVGFWKNDLKPSNWIFERYRNSKSPRINFIAEVDEDVSYSGTNSVKIEQKTNWGNSLSFFKPESRLSVDPNTEYILELNYKTDIWKPAGKDKGLVAQIDAYRGNKFDRQVGRLQLEESDNWKNISFIFKTGPEHTFILPVLRMEHTEGVYWVDNIKLYPKPITANSIEFVDEDVVIKPGQEVFLNYRSEPENININTIEWEVENENVVSVENGTIRGLRTGTSMVTLCSIFDRDVCDSIKVTVDDEISISNFSFNQKHLDINIDKKLFLEGSLKPKYANIEDMEFISQDESVVKVEDNLIIPVKTGTTNIEARYNGKIMDTLPITVKKNDYPMIQNILNVWESQLITTKIDNSLSQEYRKKIIAQGENLYSEMCKSHGYRSSLWPETKPTHSSNMTDQFRKLRDVVIAFRLEESSLYENRKVYFEIIDAIHFLYKNYGYNGNRKVFKGNWWDYQIGSTKALSDILVLLDRYTDEETMYKLSEPASNYVPNAVDQMSKEGDISTGANRTDIALGVLATASLQRQEDKLYQLQQDIMPVFDLVEKGDGLYADGSMIQHEFIPYTGGYGAVYLDGIATILSRLQNTTWEVPLSAYEHLYDVLEKGFLPLIYQGRLMSMVQGRGMSRSPKKMKTASALGGGYALTLNLLAFSDLGPKDFRTKVYSLAHNWIKEQSNKLDIFEHLSSMHLVDIVSQVLDFKVNDDACINGLYLYPNMDRVVYHHNDFGLGISMYSSRIANFESFSGENMNGWYTGDGMFYLYTKDDRQFGPSYWPTVNPYRLPGVTLDTRPLQPSSGERQISKEDFVGGAGSDRFASIAFKLNKEGFNNQNLKANKSYFILDDKVIFLGSEITGKSNFNINTIVDNRIFDKSVGDLVYVDGEEVDIKDEEVAKKWISVESKSFDTKVTYLSFGNELYLGKETRKGTYGDINTLFGDQDVHEEDYIYIEARHGRNVKNEKYAHMAVLNRKEQEIEEMYNNNPIKIISDSDGLHAVYDEDNGVLAINVFKDNATINLENFDLMIEGLILEQGSYIFDIQEDRIISYAADPSQKQDKTSFQLLPSKKIDFLSKGRIEVEFPARNGLTIKNIHPFKFLNKNDEIELPSLKDKEDERVDIEDSDRVQEGFPENINHENLESTQVTKNKKLNKLPNTGKKSIVLIATILIFIGLFVEIKERKE